MDFEKYYSNIMAMKFVENTVQDYLISALIVLVTVLVAFWVRNKLRKRLEAWAETSQTKLDDFVIEKLFPPIIYILLLVGVAFALGNLKIGPEIRLWIDRLLFAIGLGVFFLLIMRFVQGAVDVGMDSYGDRIKEENPEDLERQLRSIERIKKQVKEILNMVLTVMAILTILSNLGVDLKAIWTSLGIGGIALALAVKEPMTNLVGRMYIFSNGLFDVGHYITFGEYSGTVTRITVFRTHLEIFSDNSKVSIPNADFVKGAVTNSIGRTKRVFKWDLAAPYDLSADEIQALIGKLRELVSSKPQISEDFCWVYLARLDVYAKVIRVWFTATMSGYEASLYFGNELLHEIQLLFEKMNIPFAFPTQTLEVKMAPQSDTSAPPPVLHPQDAE